MPYVRTVKTSSGAMAVQIVHSYHRGSREIEHIGSAHDDAGVELLKAAARQRLAAGQGELDLGLGTAAPGGPLPITASRMGCLLDALEHAYRVLGLDAAASGGMRCSASWCWRGSSSRSASWTACGCWRKPGVAPASYPTVNRRLRVYAKDSLAAADLRGVRRARRGWARPAWCSTTCPRCISRPMRVTGSARAGSPRSGGSNRRSPSGCSPARTGSR